MPERVDINDEIPNNSSPEKRMDEMTERATTFSKFLIALLRRSEFDLKKDKGRLLIGDIGCGTGEEIGFMLKELSQEAPDVKTHIVAVDPSEPAISTLKDILFIGLEIPKEDVTIIQDSARNPEILDQAKQTEDERYDLFLLRNPDLHSGGGWKQTFDNMNNDLDKKGLFVLTCADELELKTIEEYLEPYNLDIHEYDVGGRRLTHLTQPEKYWIVARKKSE